MALGCTTDSHRRPPVACAVLDEFLEQRFFQCARTKELGGIVAAGTAVCTTNVVQCRARDRVRLGSHDRPAPVARVAEQTSDPALGEQRRLSAPEPAERSTSMS